MKNLYDVLGIEKTADKAAVRKAYRGKAKKAHPDAGGSKEQFALIKLAVDVLSDDVRRAQYDKTGNAAAPEPDNEFSEMMNFISVALGQAIERKHQSGEIEFIMTWDVISLIRVELTKLEEKARCEIGDMKKAILLNGDLAARIKRKPKEGAENLLSAMLHGSIGMINEQIATRERHRKAIIRANEFLSDYEFDRERMTADMDRQMRSAKMMSLFSGR